MERIAFAPLIDLPLAIAVLALFIWHFNHWAVRKDLDTPVNVAARLPAARLRVTAFFATVLFLSWLSNFAIWAIFAVLIGAGLAIALSTGGNLSGGAFGLWGIAYLIREWAFGFPQLILHPQADDANIPLTSEVAENVGKVGVTTSPLRPTGDAEIDGVTRTVTSQDGRLLDVGVNVTVTSYRNGRLFVAPSSRHHSE